MVTVHRVDAFSAAGQGGNPAGVVVNAEALSPLQMQKIAALGTEKAERIKRRSSIAAGPSVMPRRSSAEAETSALQRVVKLRDCRSWLSSSALATGFCGGRSSGG